MNCTIPLQALILSSAIACAAKSQEFVKIDYLGTIYKPIETLVVSKVKIVDTALFITYVTLDEEKYSRFKDTILTYLPKNYKRGDSEFGCFMVTLNTNGKNRSYFIPNKRISVRYFRKVLPALKYAKFSNELTDVIQMYLTRIAG